MCAETYSRAEIELVEDEAGRVEFLSEGKYKVNVFIRLPPGKTIWDIRFKKLQTFDGSQRRHLGYVLTDQYDYDGTRMQNALPYPIQFPNRLFETYAVAFEDATALDRPKYEVRNGVFFLNDDYNISFGTVTMVDAKFNRAQGGAFDRYDYRIKSFDSGVTFHDVRSECMYRLYHKGQVLLWKTQGNAKLVVAVKNLPFQVRCEVLESVTIENGDLHMNWSVQDLDEHEPLYTVWFLLF